MLDRDYDVIVVGAGPGGATAAALSAKAGLRTLMLDKYRFPRDKICGDAVSGKSMGVMRKLGLEERIEGLPHTPIWGVTFGGPQGDLVSIPFASRTSRDRLPGFVCRRTSFDRLVFDAAVESGADIWQECEVRSLLRSRERVDGVRVDRNGRALEIRAPLVIGADGAYSTVARELGMLQLRPKHYVAGLRSYYENLQEYARPGFIELHFVDEILPGYFWIFALPNGAANVGIGMLSASVKQEGINLKAAFDAVVSSPRFAKRFASAHRVGRVVGWGLPLGSQPRDMAGDGWMLVGDAASLIDPFTGEGIGNAMVSGMRAAEWSRRAADAGDFSAGFLRGYEAAVLDGLRDELRLSHTLQRMLRWRRLVDVIIRKASRSEELASTISSMFDDLDVRRKLLSPRFYLRLLRA